MSVVGMTVLTISIYDKEASISYDTIIKYP